MFYRTLLKKLNHWKTDTYRKPLVIRGARQVGKSTVIKMFSKEFDYYISLNLEKSNDAKIFEQTDNVQNILKILFLNNNISPKENDKILLFIDEIQNSSQAIKLLRYFYEEANHIFVIAAGSLLETLLNKQISFPVGRVEYLILRPFTFEEYLLAKDEKIAHELCCSLPFQDFGHDKLLSLFSEYCLIGGMPEIVKTYLETDDLVKTGKIFDNLIATYLEDVEKYSHLQNQITIIRHIIKNSFLLAGERIKFEGFGNSNYKSRDVSECFKILEKTFLVSLVYPTVETKIPIMENIRKSPKLHILDTGLINKFAGLQTHFLNNNLLDNIFEGKIAEHITGQELIALDDSILAKKYFWVREKNQSNAEVDYVIQVDNFVIPIEVKAGKTGRLRSLLEFMDLAPHHFAVRISSNKFSIEKCNTLKGKPFFLLNLPFYLIFKIRDYINILLEK